MGNSVFDEKQPARGNRAIVPADGTDPKLFFGTAIGGLCRLDALAASTDSAVDLTARLYYGLYNSALVDLVPFATVIIPAGAGNGTVPTCDVLAQLIVPLQAGFAFPYTDGLLIALETALATGKTLWVWGLGGEL